MAKQTKNPNSEGCLVPSLSKGSMAHQLENWIQSPICSFIPCFLPFPLKQITILMFSWMPQRDAILFLILVSGHFPVTNFCLKLVFLTCGRGAFPISASLSDFLFSLVYLEPLWPNCSSCSAWLYRVLFCCGAGVWTQGLRFARQACYQLGHSTSTAWLHRVWEGITSRTPLEWVPRQ
jgi:hypothetical protein